MKRDKYIYKLKLKDIPNDLLPREKAKKFGLSTLSDVEILALILGNGIKNMNVLGLANLILKNKRLNDLKSMKLEDLTKIKGVGEVKALQILAIGELLKRANEENEEKIVFNSPNDVFKYLKDLRKAKQEKMIALYTNTSNELLGSETVAIGSLNILSVKPRDIFIYALRYNAYGIIIAHNHPEGEAKPSKEDINFTKKVQLLAKELGFEILDHIIVGKKDYFSFLNNNLI
ncbi:MAG: hypothetical protein DSY60_02610 [Persephonella sp.]|nr:MAG: hypothetical protein DSY60_02610 [Persephonella sp.]